MSTILRARWLAGLGWVFGSVPATALAGWTACVVVGAAAAAVIAGTALGLLQAAGCVPGRTVGWFTGPGTDLGLAVVLAWAAVQAGYRWYLLRCRRLSTALGLQVVELMPECPALVAALYRRKGLPAEVRPRAFTIHVNTSWRAPDGMPPQQARQVFGELYTADYDRVLGELGGTPVLLASSTFNRHDSGMALQAMAEGWGWQAAGPLLPAQPRLNGPGKREREQVRMFGAVVSTRRVSSPGQWRARLFDCQHAAGTDTCGSATADQTPVRGAVVAPAGPGASAR